MTTPEPRLPEDFSDVEEIPSSSGRLRVALEISAAILVLVGIYYIFAPAQKIELPPLKPQEIDPIIREEIEATRQQSAPPALDGDAPQAPAPQGLDDANRDEPLPDGAAARRLIGELRSGGSKLSYSELVQQARHYRDAGDLTDAYLLLFYAARQGDGEAAFDLASLQDPNHFKPGSSLLEAPDAFQAQKWYSLAAEQNVPQAKERLQALRNTLQQKANAGDMTARRMLLNWQ